MSEHWSPGVARAMHELANATPAAPAANDVSARHLPSPRRPTPWLATVALVMAIGAVVGLVAIVGTQRHTAGGTGSVHVFHTHVETSMTFHLDCTDQIDNTGKFTSTVIDTWSDRAGKRWKSRIQYQDGSTHETIYFGSAIYPTRSFERGTSHDARVGCVGPKGDDAVLATGPGLPYSLSITPELSPDELPYVMPLSKIATPLKAPGTDDRGRVSKVWEVHVDGGGMSFDGGAELAMTQLQQWWVDPSDDQRITQRRFSTAVDTLGTGSFTETLDVDETIDVPESVFSTDGFTPLPFSPRPSLPTPPPSALVTTPPTGDPATWRLDPSFTVTPETRTLHVLVTRLGCNTGVTGVVNPPDLSAGTNNVRITFTVEHSAGGRCPGNDEVPYTVDLSMAVGVRLLYDGACADGAPAAAMSVCTDDKGVRWGP
jgi:hypothetical protein